MNSNSKRWQLLMLLGTGTLAGFCIALCQTALVEIKTFDALQT